MTDKFFPKIKRTEPPIKAFPLDLLFATLPYKNPSENSYRKQSNGRILTISTILNAQHNVHFGIPYGKYARLLLYTICSEIRRTKQSTVYLGDTIKEVLEKLSLGQSKRNDGASLKKLRDQIDRLSNCVFQISTVNSATEDFATENINFLLCEKFISWKCLYDGSKKYRITVTRDFYDYIVNTPITVFDSTVLKKLGKSATLLDLYVYLNCKAYGANKSRKDLFISYESLYTSFGTRCGFNHFKVTIRKNLNSLIKYHPGLIISSIDKKGFTLSKDSYSNVKPAEKVVFYNGTSN